MMFSKWQKVVGLAVSLGVVPGAFAAEAVKLTCPAGHTQKRATADQVACVSNADASKANGPVVHLYPTGEKMAEGQVVNGERSGKWTLYNKAGVVTDVIHFQRGNFDGEKVSFHA